MATINLHGLKNCDTCRKAMKALESAGHNVKFHDVRTDGVTKAQITKWATRVGFERQRQSECLRGARHRAYGGKPNTDQTPGDRGWRRGLRWLVKGRSRHILEIDSPCRLTRHCRFLQICLSTANQGTV